MKRQAEEGNGRPAGRRQAGEAVPLSRSPLWERQRRYFLRTGVEAWRRNIVPSYITSNPFIAHGYGQVLRGYFADLRRAGGLPEGRPLTIVELGAGSGRFSHYLLRALLAGDPGPEGLPPLRYVMSEIGRSNLDFWRGNRRLQPYFERGLLDLARFDPERDAKLKLEISGATLEAGSGPLAVVANYLFDSIPHDVFAVRQGRLLQGLVRVANQGALEDTELRYRFRACRPDHYGDPDWDAILADYAAQLPDGAFSMPVTALRMLANLRRLAGERLLLLSADKAFAEIPELSDREPPQPVGHGSVSFTVNFHALAEWARRQGGLALTPGRAMPALSVLALALGGRPAQHGATTAAYRAHVGSFGPDDFYVLRRHALGDVAGMGLRELVALLRFTHACPATLLRCADRLAAVLPEAAAHERQSARDLLLEVWEQDLPLEESGELAACLHRLLLAAGDPAAAAAFARPARPGRRPARVAAGRGGVL